MAKKRDDYLINLVITSQNLAEGNLGDLSKQLGDIDQQLKNIEQSERKRTDTIRGQQRATADYSKETERLVEQNRKAAIANEKETKSISDKVAAVEKQDLTFSNFFKNFEKSIKKINRDIEKQKLDIDTTGIKASLVEVEEAIVNVDKALKRENLSKTQTKGLNNLKERLILLKQSYSQEAKNIGIRKQALADEEKQIKTQESLAKAREDAENKARRFLGVQEQAIKLDRQIADADRKKAKAKKDLIILLSKEEQMTKSANTGRQAEIAAFEAWQEEIKKTRRELERYGATQEEINEIEENAARSTPERAKRLAVARNNYAKASRRENEIAEESVSRTSEQITELEVLAAKKEEARQQIDALGGSYQDLDKATAKSTKETERNARTIDKLRNVLAQARSGTDVDRNPLRGFVVAFRNAADESAILSRKLGRLGLAIRGLAIVGILAFLQSFISVIGALGAQLVALVGSILSASAAIAVTFVSAVAQAVPVVGVLAAAFNRLTAIQEAVNQADLAQKNAFGDTGAQKQAADAALQIADAQRRVKEAQEEVTEARREAKKELEELILKEREAELAFKSATLSQLEARRALRETIESGDVESISRSQLGVEESDLAAVRARRELRESRQARRQGLRGGPEGTETYKNAVKSLTEAQRALAQAQSSAADSANTQSAAQRNLAYFLNELSDAERKLFKQFMQARERYEKVFRPITDIIIMAFSRAFSRVEKLLFSGEIVNGFRSLAQVLGGSFDRLSKTLTSPVFKEFFVEMIRQAANNMPLLTDGLILLANIFRNIALAAGPVFRALLEFIVEKLDQFNQKVSETGALTEFLMMGERHFEAWIELIISILGLMGELMQASSGSALEMLTSLTDTINGAKESLRNDDTGARNFFDDAAQSAKEMGRVIVALGEVIVNLTSSGQVKALADIFTEMLIPGMEQGIKIVVWFALALDKLAINFVAKMLQFGVSLFFVVSAWSAVKAIFLPGIKLITGLASAFGLTGTFIKSFVANLSIVKSVSGAISKAWLFSSKPAGMIGILKSIPTAIANSGGAFAVFRKGLAAIPVVGWAVAAVIEVIVGAVMALKDNFWGVADSMRDALGELGNAFDGLFSSSGEGGSALLNTLGTILNVIFDILGFVSKVVGAIALLGIIEIVIKPLTTVIKIIDNAIDTIDKFISLLKKGKIGAAFKTLARGIGRGFGLAIGLALKLITAIPRLVIKLARKIVSGVAKLVWKGIKALGGLLFKAVGSLANFVISSFTNPSSWAERFQSILNVVGNLAKGILNLLVEAGKGLGEGIISGIGGPAAETIVNTFVKLINGLISAYNAIPIAPDIGEVGEVDFTPEKTSAGPSSKSDSAGRGKARATGSKGDKKVAEENKAAAKSGLENYKALNMVGGASKKNIRLNNQLADSLGKSGNQHKRAQNLQEQLNKAAARGRRQQNLYAESIRQTTRVEERYANSLARARRIKSDTNDKDRASTRIRERMASSTRAVSKAQGTYYNSTVKATAVSGLFNQNLKRGANLHEKLASRTKKTTSRTEEHTQATNKLNKRLGKLNKVLMVTGQNSRALGMVFKRVTNRLLKEFNVKPLEVELPSVDGMFKDAMGSSQQFQRGGYFGSKGQRGPDDRTIMVAGGEAILTGNHQAAVDTAFSIANQTAGFPYQNLDHMFNRDKRPHASAKKYNRGGRVPGYAKGGIVIPKSVPDAMGALPGLDLMGFLLNKYFGLSVTDGIRAAGTLTSSGNISDHTWGGAIDVSNGSSPTPQMDSAWFWLTRVLGGAKAGSFVENYVGGAIKQMLYRTNIGGNHFDHIHLALTETYARNVELLTKILTGKAIPVATGGMMFAQAPQLKKPKIKSNNKGSIQKMLQGQSDKLTKGANKYLKENIVPISGAMDYAPVTAAIDPGTKIKTGYTVYNDPPPGAYGGSLTNGYAELGTATTSGLTGGGYMAQAFGLAGELPENFPVDVTINGRTKRLYKRDRGWGQGTSAYGIDIWQDSWGFYGLNATSGGQAIVTAANKAKKKGKPGPKYQIGGNIPEFDDGGIVPGPIGQPRLIKAHGGELVLPTHKYNTGGLVPRYQTGGMADGIPVVTTYGDVKNKTGQNAAKKLQNQIKKLTKKLNKEKDEAAKNSLLEQIKQLKDQLLLSTEVKAYNREIKDLNQQIRKKEKKIRKASDDKKKELKKELGELKRDLSEAKKNKKATVAFEGELYNTNIIQEFILLISDRIKAFLKKLEEGIVKIAAATAKWTYSTVIIDGQKVITKVNSAVEEATRALSDLFAENELITGALAEAVRGQKRARKKLKKVRDKYSKEIGNQQDKLADARKDLKNADTKEEKEEAKKEIKKRKKNIKKLRKDRKNDIKKLETSINNSNETIVDLQQQLADNLAAIYEQQIAVFEEKLAEIDSQMSMLDTQAEIVTAQNTTKAGNLTDAGKQQLRDIYGQRGAALESQASLIRSELEKARAVGDVQRTKELEQALLENQLAILQNTESIRQLDTALEDALSAISSTLSMLDTQIEIVTLQNTSTAGNLSQAGKDIIAGIFAQRATALEEQRGILEQQLAEARAEGDTLRVKELEQALLENQLAVLQNTKSILELDTTFEDALSEIDSRMSRFDTEIEIAKLEQADIQGNLTEEGKSTVRAIYEQRAAALREQAEILRQQLAAAMEEGDEIRSRELEQAILENRLALLQNTKSIEELDNSIGGIFDFRSTNWEQFRQAIFSNGNILPQFRTNIPQLASGGYVRREGLAYLHAAEVVTPASKTGNTGTIIDTINFTQPMEVADPVAISNQIGFKLSTLKSL